MNQLRDQSESVIPDRVAEKSFYSRYQPIPDAEAKSDERKYSEDTVQSDDIETGTRVRFFNVYDGKNRKMLV